jgi:methylated-DNA-[protein]-cysteine S-methyltransferase
VVIDVRQIDSPVGPLTLAVRDARLCMLRFGHDTETAAAVLRRWYPESALLVGNGSSAMAARLDAYFAGQTAALNEIPVEMNGTPFQRRVWEALRAIPAGTTVSYGEVARRIDAPSAVRAVGAANGANPVAIVVPCHRVIGGSGRLTGYGGGLERKQWLLRHEQGATLF